MRDMGTITGGGNGLQGAGMADTSVNGSPFYKTNLELTHLKKTKNIQNTHRAILNLSKAKTGFLLGILFGGAKSIVMQISFVMLLFLDQNSGRGKSFQGGQTASGGTPCPL